jgi:hypothetical protein
VRRPNGMTADLFWSRVDQSGECWPWTGACSQKGYGEFVQRGKKVATHRFAYSLAFGPVPDGLWVLHHCDNPPCCNPTHLWLGTHQDNVNDKMAKGRDRNNPRTGERHPAAKLTPALIRDARQRVARQERTTRQLSKEYGVHEGTLSRAIRGKSWKEVK